MELVQSVGLTISMLNTLAMFHGQRHRGRLLGIINWRSFSSKLWQQQLQRTRPLLTLYRLALYQQVLRPALEMLVTETWRTPRAGTYVSRPINSCERYCLNSRVQTILRYCSK